MSNNSIFRVSISLLLFFYSQSIISQSGYEVYDVIIETNKSQGWLNHYINEDGTLTFFKSDGLNILHMKHYHYAKQKKGKVYAARFRQYVIEVDCIRKLHRYLSGKNYEHGRGTELYSITYAGAMRIFPGQWSVADFGTTLGAEISNYCGKSPINKVYGSYGSSDFLNNGTGFIISSEGHIATNFHVIDGFEGYRFKVNNSIYDAKLLIKDPSNDLAILKIDNFEYHEVQKAVLLTNSSPRLGEVVFAMGYPLTEVMGENIKVTDGIISSLSGVEDNATQIQVSIPLQPGNSGSPVFNQNGHLVGIVTSGLNRLVSENVSYATKIIYLMPLLNINESIFIDSELNADNVDKIGRVELIEKLREYIGIIQVK